MRNITKLVGVAAVAVGMSLTPATAKKAHSIVPKMPTSQAQQVASPGFGGVSLLHQQPQLLRQRPVRRRRGDELPHPV